LQQRQIGLWDVLHSCERVGSLDSAIKNAIPNDFAGLFATHPEVKVVAFNGQKANEWFERWVTVNIPQKKLTLPSTSPAAAMPFAKKVASWSVLTEMMKS
jgi:hypoxanthine-DNA glycosylase